MEVLKRSRNRKSVPTRILLWVFRKSDQTVFHGVTVAADGAEEVVKIEGAFALLARYGRRALSDLRRCTDGVLVFGTAGPPGEWHGEARLVVLDDSYVQGRDISAESIASTLVHEATHARLELLGFTYTRELRTRIEKVCFRRQLAFARRFPDADDLVSEIERRLAATEYLSDYLSDEAFHARTIGKLHELGVPKVVVHSIEWLSLLRRRIRRNRTVS